jgi:hypothetical protein
MNEGHSPKTRKKSRLPVITALVISIATLLAVFGYRVYRVAALQGALVKRERVLFAGGEPPSPGPAWANKAVGSLMQYVDGTDAEKTVWRERLLALFRSETDVIVFTTSDSFHTNFAPALQRFPKLRALVIRDVESGTLTKDDIDTLFTVLSSMEHLEHIQIDTPFLTDDAFAKLTGHPKLKKITIGKGKCSVRLLETLKTLPNLKELTIGTRSKDSKWNLENPEQLYRDALPGVTVSFLTSF